MRKDRGFTLIELLIVVAIIGIIAAIAIPNLLNAIHRGRQKRSMADMRTIATAIGTYATDMNYYPRGMATLNDFVTHLEPTYIRRVPSKDGWNTTYNAFTDAAGDHYTIESWGKNKIDDGCTVGQETSSFDCDICHLDGMFAQWPEGIQRE
jgi:general secretion pathway protein G